MIGMGDACAHLMERLNRYVTTHPGVARVASILVLLFLAACNNGSDGSNPGGGGY